MSRVVFSGIQPSGNLHIGNYIGAVSQWVAGQGDGLNIFCIVDLHAITVPQEPEVLREKTLEVAGLLIAAGLDPNKVLLFVQSHNSDHANLGWVLNCYISMGQLQRMTQFKDKSEGRESVSAGLFDYPALMAADILAYDTTEVPVGEDQKQHVELTRDVAERFNSRYGQTFVLPQARVPTVGGRVMSLVDPTKKMSKSDPNPMGAVGLLDDKDLAVKKIMSAVTDSGTGVRYDEAAKPGVSNLIEIYSQLTAKDIGQVEAEFSTAQYGVFKKAVAEAVVAFLEPLQARYSSLRNSGELGQILAEGAKRAGKISHAKLAEVYEKVGLAAA